MAALTQESACEGIKNGGRDRKGVSYSIKPQLPMMPVVCHPLL